MDSLYGPKVTGTTANTALECLWYINHGHLRWFAQDLCSAARAAYCVFRCINLIAMPFFHLGSDHFFILDIIDLSSDMFFSCLPDTSPEMTTSVAQTP